MPRLTNTVAVTLVVLGGAHGAAQTIAITGGTVYPVSGAPISNGTVLMRDGRIVAVGSDVAVPADAQRIDATGKIVTPGIVNAATELSVVDIGAVAATRNVSARGREGIAAAFTVWDGLNPVSVLIPPARSAGITSVLIAPRGGIISGQAGVLHLVEGSAADMVMRSPVAMVGQIGSPQQANAQYRGELLLRLRGVLGDPRATPRRKAEFERAQTRQFA